MTAISRAKIRSTIRSRGDYKNIRAFPDDYLNDEIQTAYGHACRIVDEAHQGWRDTEDTVVTVSGQRYVALPATCKGVKAIDRLDGGEYVEMPQVGIDQRNRFGEQKGKPLAHRLSQRGLELYPIPDGVYTIRVTFTPKPETLTENEEHEFYDGWEDFVIEKVLWELDSREGKPLGDRERKLDAAEKALRSSSNARRQVEPEYLRLREFSDDPYDDGVIG